MKDYTKIVDLWMAELVDDKVQVKIDPKECETFAWVQLHQALKLTEYATTKNALTIADDFVKKNVLSAL